MKRTFTHGRVELMMADIVEQEVDAIANAANTGLLGGGGVDGAIHRAAGPELLAECTELPTDSEGRRCPTGEVRVTGAGKLAANYVIHGVGPIYDADRDQECAELLSAVYRTALHAAAERECRSVAFPAISMGVYGYPPPEAARIAIDTAATFLETQDTTVKDVRFVLFSQAALGVFELALAQC